jgi:hypothetical protein
MFKRLCFLYKIDFILKDNDILQLHDFDSGKMLRCLRLRAGFISGDEEESGVHDGSTVQHRSHQNIVAGTIDEGDMADKFHSVTTPRAFTRRAVFLI